MAKLICVQLETCHANDDAVAWYAYFKQTDDEVPIENENSKEAVRNAIEEEGPLGLDEDEDCDWEEVPNKLSKYAGLRRFYVGGAS